MRFLVVHPLEPGVTRERLDEIMCEIPPEISHHRSFMNLTEGRGVCVVDAPNREVLVKWMDEHSLPWEAVWMVEVEGKGKEGELIEVASEENVSP